MDIFEYFEWEKNDFSKAKSMTPDWRLGQAYYVQFDKTGREFPELYYEADEDKARELIFKVYITG